MVDVRILPATDRDLGMKVEEREELIRRALPTLPPALPEKDHGEGLGHDAEVFDRGNLLHVFQVVADLDLHVLDAPVVVMVHLCETCDPGKDPLTRLVSVHLFAELPEDFRLFRAGADDVHISLQDIEKLGEFVEAVLPKDPSHPGDSGVVGDGPLLLPVPFGAVGHGPELIDLENSASQIPLSSGVGARGPELPPAIESHPGLGEKDWPP